MTAAATGPKPPPGYTQIPGSKHGGFHKQVGGVWRTWYPKTGIGLHPTERFTQDEHEREHAAFRETTEGRRHTARESIAVLSGEQSMGEASPHAQRVLEHLRDRSVRVFEPEKPTKPEKPAKPSKDPKATAKAAGDQAWRDQVKGLSLTKQPGPGVTDVKVHIAKGDDPDTKAVMTWRDSKGNQQSAHTVEYTRRSAAQKFERVARLVERVDAVRDGAHSQAEGGVTKRERDAGAVVALIEATGLRNGSRAAAKRSDGATFGTSSLRPEHVIDSGGDTVKVKFPGKAGVGNERTVDDPWLVDQIRKRVAEPGTGGFLFDSDEEDTRRTLSTYAGAGYKAHDLRTLWTTRKAIDAFEKFAPKALPKDEASRKKVVEQWISKASDEVAKALGDTKKVTQTSYIHPSVIATNLKWLGAGDLVDKLFKGGAANPLGRYLDAAKSVRLPKVDETVDENGDVPDDLEQWPLSMIADYATAGAPKKKSPPAADKIVKGGFASLDDAERAGARAEQQGTRLIDPTDRLPPVDKRPSPTAIRRLLAEWCRKVKGSTNARAVQAAIGKGNYTEAKRLMELDMARDDTVRASAEWADTVIKSGGAQAHHKVKKSFDSEDPVASVNAWADTVIKGVAGLDSAWLDATLRDCIRVCLRYRTDNATTKTDEQLARDVSDRLVARVLGNKDATGSDRLARLLKDDEEAAFKRALKLVPEVRGEFPTEAASLPAGSANGILLPMVKLAVPHA